MMRVILWALLAALSFTSIAKVSAEGGVEKRSVSISAWKCPMNCEGLFHSPGQCPKCGMDLEKETVQTHREQGQAPDGNSGTTRFGSTPPSASGSTKQKEGELRADFGQQAGVEPKARADVARAEETAKAARKEASTAQQTADGAADAATDAHKRVGGVEGQVNKILTKQAEAIVEGVRKYKRGDRKGGEAAFGRARSYQSQINHLKSQIRAMGGKVDYLWNNRIGGAKGQHDLWEKVLHPAGVVGQGEVRRIAREEANDVYDGRIGKGSSSGMESKGILGGLGMSDTAVGIIVFGLIVALLGYLAYMRRKEDNDDEEEVPAGTLQSAIKEGGIPDHDSAAGERRKTKAFFRKGKPEWEFVEVDSKPPPS